MIHIIYLCIELKCSEHLQKNISVNDLYNLSVLESTNITYEFDCEVLLGNENPKNFCEPSYEDLVEYENFLDNISPFSKLKEPNKNLETLISSNFTSYKTIFYSRFEEYIKLFYDNLDRYIKYHLAKTFTKTYLVRLDRIMQIINMVS